MDNNIELRVTVQQPDQQSINGAVNGHMDSGSTPIANGGEMPSQDISSYAVLARNAEKSYSRLVIKKGRQILRRLNLSVKSSSV